MATAIRSGWVQQFEASPHNPVLRLTLRGADAANRWKSLQTAAEQEWCGTVRGQSALVLREALNNVVAALPLEHPHYPASYGAADASITGGNGQDWKAVPRRPQDTVSDLPLSALVSQTLVAFAIEYEQLSPVALALSTAVISRIPPEGRPLRGLAASSAISALVRHRFLNVIGQRGQETVRLTAEGAAVREAIDERIQAVETRWLNQFGNRRMGALRRALEGVLEATGQPRSQFQSGAKSDDSSVWTASPLPSLFEM